MPQTDANEPHFVVTDRRHFTASGERREDVPEETGPPAAAVEIGTPPPEVRPANKSTSGKKKPAPPQAATAALAAAEAEATYPAEPGGAINFVGFLDSLYASALMQLGAPAPGQISRPEPDLEGARQTIEILGLLQQKTKGNLTAAEAQALEEILYELRMVYVQLTRQRGR